MSTRRATGPNGYIGPGLCSVCRRPDSAEIDHAVVQKGVRRSAVARRFGLGRESLRRHVANHLHGRLREASRASQAAPADELLERMRAHNETAIRILDKAIADGRPETALKALGEIRAQLKFEAELQGAVGPRGGTTVNVLAIDPDAAVRALQIYAQRHAATVPALAPVSVETTALRPASAGAEPIEEDE